MADGIDPNIALSYRPPNLATMPNLQIQTPLESLARVVSLRSLMQEGELKGLQLQQLRQQIAEQQALSKLYASAYGTDATQAPTQPLAPVQPNLPAPPATPLTGGAPVTSTGVDMTAGLDKYLTPPGLTPATPQAVAPAPQPPTVSASQLMAPQVPQQVPQQATSGSIPGWPSQYPTPAQIMRAAPISGPAVIKQFTDQQKDLLDLYAKNQTIAKNNTEDFVRMANGSTDNESFQHNLVDMAKNGYITSDQARQYSALGFDDPKTQAWLYSTRMQAVSADKAQEMKLALIDDARKGLMFNEQYPAAREDRKQKAYVTASQSIGDLQDKKELPGWIANQDPAVLERYGQYLNSNLPLDQIKRIVQEGAGAGPKAAEAAATTRATEAAKEAEWVRQHEAEIQGVMSGQYQLDNFSPEDQSHLKTEIARRQAPGAQTPPQPAAPQAAQPAQQPTEAQPQPQTPPQAAPQPAPPQPQPQAAPQAPPPKVQFGKPISDEERQRITDLNELLTLAQNTQKVNQDPYNRTFMGAPSIALKHVPGLGSQMQKIDSSFELLKQKAKAFSTNKSLRGLSPESLTTMFPDVGSSPSVNDYKIQQIINTVRSERDQFVKDLGGKVLPPGMTLPGSAPTPQPAPSKQPQAAPTQIPADVQKLVGPRKGKYTFPDGRVFYRKADGSIVAGQ